MLCMGRGVSFYVSPVSSWGRAFIWVIAEPLHIYAGLFLYLGRSNLTEAEDEGRAVSAMDTERGRIRRSSA